MWKPVWIGLACVSVLMSVVFYTSATSTFYFRCIRWPGKDVIVDKYGARIQKVVSIPITAGGTAKAVIEESLFEFGRMDPETKAKHGFIVRNEGTGPLQLHVGSTSCKCTVGGVGKSVIAPGESTSVVLEWNTGRTMIKYEQTATVHTNDPQLKSFDLKIRGLVRQDICSTIEELDCEGIEPGKSATVETVLYSQIWNDFTVTDLTTNLAGIKWEILPFPNTENQPLDATCMQLLRVTVPGDRRQGGFQDLLRLTVRPVDPIGEAVKLEISIKGKTMRRLAIYGPTGSSNGEEGTIDLGYVPEGKAKTMRLLVKVRDAETELKVGPIKIEPAFVKVRLEPHGGENGTKGLYDLFVELPDDAPTCQFRGNPEGSIHIDLDHPRIKEIDMKLIFSVVPNP